MKLRVNLKPKQTTTTLIKTSCSPSSAVSKCTVLIFLQALLIFPTEKAAHDVNWLHRRTSRRAAKAKLLTYSTSLVHAGGAGGKAHGVKLFCEHFNVDL